MVSDIKFCKKCLYSSEHPLGITFNEDGVCSGCLIHEEKEKLDWNLRFKKLLKIVKRYKSKTKKNYDCIVPVTGGQDSYFIVHIVKNILKLNPLLVCNNKYFNTPLGIKNLTNLRIRFDCDILIQNININSVKKITRYTLNEYGNIYWPVIAGQTLFPVNISVKYKIPLIIWGAHQGLEQVGMFSHEHEVEMTRRFREDHDLFGIEAENLLNLKNNLTEEDIWQYRYPDDKILNSIGVRGIYLGNYIKWDPAQQHQLMVKKFGFKTAKSNRTFDTYDHVDCFNYLNLHDKLKLFKHGYSKVTDHACREIRFNRLTRNTAIKLVKKYELEKVNYSDKFSEWLDIDTNSLNFILDQFKNKKFWKQKSLREWNFNGLSKRLSFGHDLKVEKKMRTYFTANDTLESGEGSDYIIFGKGI